MIRIIEGASGIGKTDKIYQELIEKSMENTDKNYFLIVPDQYTMQAQRQFVQQHPRGGSMNVDVVSFNRLAHRIFEELAIDCGTVLEDFGKSMVLEKILLENRSVLKGFAGSARKRGFIDELKSLLTELFQYRIDENQLRQVEEQLPESPLKNKLQDLLCVYHEFQAEIADEYIVAEHILELFARRLKDSSLLAGCEIYFDGFTGFTPIQYQAIESLNQVAEKMHFTVTIDEMSVQKDHLEEYELFHLSKNTLERIKGLQEETQVVEELLLGDSPRFKEAAGIAALEKSIFRYPYEVSQNHEGVEIVRTANPRQEFLYVAREIREMVRKGECRYRDIAIISGDLEETDIYAKELLPGLGIPYFVDANKRMEMNPVLESVRSFLAMINQDFHYHSVFRYLKTGVTKLCNREEIELLENYICKRGIRGYSWWEKEFGRNKNTSEADHKMKKQDIQAIEIGEKVFQKLIPNIQKIKAATTIGEYVNAVYDYMENFQVEKRLQELEECFEENGDYVMAKAYGQVYDKMNSVLEKLEGIMGSQALGLEDFMDLMDTGLEGLHLGVIPPNLDQITIGDIQRTRLGDIQMLYVIGVNDGIIPAPSKVGGILSQQDRKGLADFIELAPSARENMFTEQFYHYLNLTKPSKKLVLTYRMNNQEGEECAASYLIGRVKGILPQLQEKIELGENLDWQSIETPEDAKDLLVLKLRQEELSEEEQKIWSALYDFYKGKNSPILEQYEQGIRYSNVEATLGHEVAKRLYGNMLMMSVSSLERYSECPYKFFLSNGLKIHKREDHEVTMGDIGSLMHGILDEIISQLIQERNLEKIEDWKQLTLEELQKLVHTYIQNVAKDENSKYNQSYTHKHLLGRIQEVGEFTLQTLWEQLCLGAMVPYALEQRFGIQKEGQDGMLPQIQYELQEDTHMSLRGIIDRIDVAVRENEVYIKIIDYKSSDKQLVRKKVDAGLQLQLLVYMKVVMDYFAKEYEGKTIIPAGALYHRMSRPVVSVEKSNSPDTIKNAKEKSLKLTGAINATDPCVEMLGGQQCVKVPGKRTKDADELKKIQKENLYMETEEFKEALESVTETVKSIGNRIMEGYIQKEPVVEGRQVNACTYCDYRSICRLDCQYGGNKTLSVTELAKSLKGGQ